MAFDLGALVTRMTVLGQREFERDIDAGGRALTTAAGKADDFGLAIGTMGSKAERFGKGLGLVGAEIGSMSERAQQASTRIGVGLTIAGVAVAALVGVAVAKYSEYDAAISRSTAVTGAYGEELEGIRELTQDLGAQTVFSATEAAEGVTELGKAGVSTANILNGALAGSLDLAAAGEIAVADAAAVAATTLNQFNLAGDQTTHVADLIAAAAGKAQGGVQDLSAGLGQSGLVASQFGISVEETVGGLAAFASAGLIGSDAGTSFRTMLLNLATPTAQQTALMKEHNISAYDAQGNFVGLADLAGQLQTAFAGSTQATRDHALGIIFGSDAIRAANVLYSEGEAGIRDWTAAVDESGYAARIAATNQDNLRGDLEKLGGAFDTLMIKFGEGADGAMRDLVTSVTAVVDGFSQMPPWMQQTILVAAALAAGVLLLGGAFLTVVPRIAETRAALAILRAEMPMTAGAMGRVASFLTGPWGIALAAASIGLLQMSANAQTSRANIQAIADTLDKATGAMTDYSRQAIIKRAVDEGLYAAAQKAGISTAQVNAAIFEGGDALDSYNAAAERYNQTQSDAGNFTRAFTGEAITLANGVKNLRHDVEASGDAWKLQQEALDEAGVAADGTGESLDGAAASADGLTEATNAANDAMAEWAGQMAEVDAAFVDIGGAYDAATEKTRALAEETAASTTDASDSWETYFDQFDIGVEGFLAQLEAQVAAQEAWEQNMILLSGRVSSGVLDELAKLGPEGAPLVADLVNASDAELARLEEAFGQRGTQATGAFGAAITTAGPIIAAAAAQLGAGAAAEIAAKLAAGTHTVEDIMREYKLRVEGFKPVVAVDVSPARSAIESLFSYQGRTITLRALMETDRAFGGVDTFQAQGSVTRFAASGMMTNQGQIAQIRRGGDITVWAEQETLGESFVPHALDRRERAEAIMAQTADIFGGMYIPARGVKGRATGAADTMSAATSAGAVAPAGALPPLIVQVAVDRRVIAEAIIDHEREYR